MVKKYRKKSSIVEAIQFQDNVDCIMAIHEFVEQVVIRVNYEVKNHPYIKIDTSEGLLIVQEGDYIVKNDGKFDVWDQSAFNKLYEEVAG